MQTGDCSHFGDRQDDLVIPFFLEHANSSGRIVRLGDSVAQIIQGHNYPKPVAHLLCEALTLTALLGSSLKTESKLTLQTQSDGLVSMLVVNYTVPGEMRGYAKFDPILNEASASDQQYDSAALLGKGHFALTLDPGHNQERRQGIVALDQTSLTKAAEHYFEQSEQISTFLQLSVAEMYQKDESATPQNSQDSKGKSNASKLNWRAGGLMVQKMGIGGGLDSSAPKDTIDLRGGSASKEDHGGYEEDWNRVSILAQTVEDHELLDPVPPIEKLLYNLFHEENVRVLPGSSVKAKCHCSEERIISVMANFTRAELAEMIEEDGNISVTCEFCGSHYTFSPEQFNKKL